MMVVRGQGMLWPAQHNGTDSRRKQKWKLGPGVTQPSRHSHSPARAGLAPSNGPDQLWISSTMSSRGMRDVSQSVLVPSFLQLLHNSTFIFLNNLLSHIPSAQLLSHSRSLVANNNTANLTNTLISALDHQEHILT